MLSLFIVKVVIDVVSIYCWSYDRYCQYLLLEL